MPALAVQTSQDTLTTIVRDALGATGFAALAETEITQLTAAVYPVLFTKDGLSAIEGNSDHYNAGFLDWRCACGEIFSHSFDGRDELYAHVHAALLEWDQIIALVRQAVLGAIGIESIADDVTVDLFARMGQGWLFAGA